MKRIVFSILLTFNFNLIFGSDVWEMQFCNAFKLGDQGIEKFSYDGQYISIKFKFFPGIPEINGELKERSKDNSYIFKLTDTVVFCERHSTITIRKDKTQADDKIIYINYITYFDGRSFSDAEKTTKWTFGIRKLEQNELPNK